VAAEEPPRPTLSEWPGLDAAYEFVRPSYEVALRRADAAEARARANLTFAGTLMFAAPAFVAATLGGGQRSFTSAWFIAGALAFVGVYVCVVIQQVPRMVGEVQVISPRGLATETWLKAEPATFKYNLLLYAATNWDANRRHVNLLLNIATLGSGLLGIQVACLAAWVFLG
jgi:hypothetical protein